MLIFVVCLFLKLLNDVVLILCASKTGSVLCCIPQFDVADLSTVPRKTTIFIHKNRRQITSLVCFVILRTPYILRYLILFYSNLTILYKNPFYFSQFSCALITSSVGKWNESGFKPPLRTYRLNWAKRTSWGWWDEWDDTVLQTQDSKFEPWRSEAEHATSQSRRLLTILNFTCGWRRNIFVSFKPPRPGAEPRTLAWKAVVLTPTLGPPPSSVGNNNRLTTIFWAAIWTNS